MAATVHLLDVGNTKYGDAVLCEVGGRTILIDGGHAGDWQDKPPHDSLPTQLEAVLGVPRPVPIDLVIVSHAHDDHIGCLPRLVADGAIEVGWAYLPSPDRSWPAEEPDEALPESARAVVSALREEDLRSLDETELGAAIASATGLRPRYTSMVDTLSTTARVVFHGDDASDLLAEFAEIDLRILGPDAEHLALAREEMVAGRQQAVAAVAARTEFVADAEMDPVALYREVTDGFGVLEGVKREGAAVNAQSTVMSVGRPGERILLAGDMQFADAEVSSELAASVEALWAAVVDDGPYQFAKLCHHGSRNANPVGFATALGCSAFGICTGRTSPHHPNPEVVDELRAAGAHWVSTDRNGRSRAVLAGGSVELVPSLGDIDDVVDPDERR